MKRIIVIILLLTLSGCKNESANELEWETYTTISVTDVEVNIGDYDCTLDCDYPIQYDLTKEDISDFRLGMSRDDILEKIGRQHSPYGSGFWIELYVIDGNNALFYYSLEDEVVVLDTLLICTSTDCKKLK